MTPAPVAPSITAHPANASVSAGQNASFTGSAESVSMPSLRWQRSSDGATSWIDLIDGGGIRGTTTETLTISVVPLEMNGHLFRFVASNAAGTVTSDAATLSVNPVVPSITVHPANASVGVGQNASFTGSAAGVPLPSFRWQRSIDNGASWSDLIDGTGISGTASTTLLISGTSAAMNGHQFRFVASNSAGSATSVAAALSVVQAREPVQITNLTVVATSELSEPPYDRFTRNLIDGQFREDGSPISLGSVWESSGIGFDGPEPDDHSPVVTFGLATNYYVRRIRLWNFPEPLVAVKRMRIEASADGVNFQTVRERADLAQSNETEISLDTAPARYLRLVILENWGGTIYPVAQGEAPGGFYGFAGLLEVAIYGEPAQFEPPVLTRGDWEFAGPQVLPFGVNGIAYGAGRWVATSWGWFTTSEDGTNWAYPKGFRSHAESWSRMAFLGGKFLWWGAASANVPSMAASEDGLSWRVAEREPGSSEPSPVEASGFVESVAFGNGTYIAVGSQWIGSELRPGAIWRSTNAYHWSRVYRLLRRNLYSVAFGDGKFIGVGDLGTVVISTNGLDWSETQDPLRLGAANPLTNRVTESRLLGVGHGPHGWFVIKSERGVVNEGLHSLNGTDWSLFTANGFPSRTFYHTFHADGKYWFTSEGGCYTTVNGTSWSMVGGSRRLALSSVRRAPVGVSPRYLAGNPTGSIYTSEDATNWTLVSGIGDIPFYNMSWFNRRTVVATDKEWLIDGIGVAPNGWNGPTENTDTGNFWVPQLDQAESWMAGRELDWKLGSLPPIGDYVWSGNRLIAVTSGVGGEGVFSLQAGPIIFRNGALELQGIELPVSMRFLNASKYKGVPTTWGSSKAILSSSDQGFDVYSEAAYFNSSPAYRSSVRWGHFTSPDGTNWTLRTQGLNNATNFPGIRGLAWGAGRFVAVGVGSTPSVPPSSERIYTSTDGENYSPVSLAGITPALGTEGLTGLAFANDGFVAIGNQGRILYSSNGLDWQTVHASDGKGWNRVRYLYDRWAVVGNEGRVAFSKLGTTWDVKNTGVENDLNDIAALNGTCMAVGNHGMVLRAIFHIGPPRTLSESISHGPGGIFEFKVRCEAHTIPVVEASTDLNVWTIISPAHTPADATGVVTFTDNSGTGSNRRFYRVRNP